MSDRAGPPSAKEVADRLLRSTYVIIAHDSAGDPVSFGSGFALTNDLVMTNEHVVRGAVQLYVSSVTDPGNVIAVDSTAVDPRRDLALLSVPGLGAKALGVAYTGPAVGDTVYVAGNPDGLTGSFTEGIVSALRTFDGTRMFQMTAAMTHGSSGGPVVNEYGALVGVSRGIRGRGENLNFAVHLAEVLSFAAQHGLTHPAMPGR